MAIIKNDDKAAIEYLLQLDCFVWSEMPPVGLGWGGPGCGGAAFPPAPEAIFPQALPTPLVLLRLCLVQFCCLVPSFFPFCALAQLPLLNASKPGEKMVGAGDETAQDLPACPVPSEVPAGA